MKGITILYISFIFLLMIFGYTSSYFTDVETSYGNMFSAGSASIANHVVISEVYPNPKNSSKGEFVELYNPTNHSINLNGWTIEDNDGKSCKLHGVIPPHGFYLIVYNNTEYKKDNQNWPNADEEVLPYLFLNNDGDELILKNSTGFIIDALGYGSSSEWNETVNSTVPGKGESLERKAQTGSTSESMQEGGEDEYLGNGQDTDNNYNDFIIRDTPQPQNSTSNPESPPWPPIGG